MIYELNVTRLEPPDNPTAGDQILINNGYYRANCETTVNNSECLYIERGCSGCSESKIKPKNIHVKFTSSKTVFKKIW